MGHRFGGDALGYTCALVSVISDAVLRYTRSQVHVEVNVHVAMYERMYVWQWLCWTLGEWVFISVVLSRSLINVSLCILSSG